MTDDLNLEINIAWLNISPISTCGEMSKVEAMQKMFSLGYEAALDSKTVFSKCEICHDIDVLTAKEEKEDV